jgi:chromosome partitioning protein
MSPIGYLLQQCSVRLSRAVKAYDRWVAQIRMQYKIKVLGLDDQNTTVTAADDPFCLVMLKHYRSPISLS